jgi:glycosyltransferase involved in cell wall biosynthesis
VTRCPTHRELHQAVLWCDVFFHNNISLAAAWPHLLLRRPWIVAHQTWISRSDRTLAWQDRLKRWLLRYARNISISQAIAASLPVESTVIGNPYDDAIFHQMPRVERSRDLIFVGRLVSDKGVDVLLQAMAMLKGEGWLARLTVVGAGPEESALRALADQLHLTDQIIFTGSKTSGEVAELLNQHRVLVVPSLWEEPFGVVALEGIACGCVVVGSAAGGLSDAIGPCGLTFPNGDAAALRDCLRTVLTDGELVARLQAVAPSHLARHAPAQVATAYLKVFAEALA